MGFQNEAIVSRLAVSIAAEDRRPVAVSIRLGVHPYIDGIAVAMSTGHGHLYQEAKASFEAIVTHRRLDTPEYSWLDFVNEIGGRHTPPDREVLRQAVQALAWAWPTDGAQKKVLDRLRLWDFSESELEGEAGESLGGILISGMGRLYAFLPTARLYALVFQNTMMPRRPDETLGDVLHEGVEIELREDLGMFRDEAHAYALQVRDCYIREGPAAAARLLAELRDPYRLARFEATFEGHLNVILARRIPLGTDLRRLTDDHWAQLRTDFLQALRRSGWHAPPAQQEQYGALLAHFLKREELLHWNPNGTLSSRDLIRILERLHAVHSDRDVVGAPHAVLLQMLLQTFNAPHTLSHAEQYRFLMEAGLAGNAWDQTRPDAQMARLLQEERFADAFELLGPSLAPERFLACWKAVAEHYAISNRNLADPFLSNARRGPTLVGEFRAHARRLLKAAVLLRRQNIPMDHCIGTGLESIVMSAKYEDQEAVVKIERLLPGRFDGGAPRRAPAAPESGRGAPGVCTSSRL